MKTQCPNCNAIQKVPDYYVNTEIKCQKCHSSFTASPYNVGNNPHAIRQTVIGYCVIFVAVAATCYSLWAYNRLQTLYRINTETLVPAYEELQNIKKPPHFWSDSPFIPNLAENTSQSPYDDKSQLLYNQIALPWGAFTPMPYTVTESMVDDSVYCMVVRICLIVDSADVYRGGKQLVTNVLMGVFRKTQTWLNSHYPLNRPCRVHILLFIPGRAHCIATLNKLELNSDSMSIISFDYTDDELKK